MLRGVPISRSEWRLPEPANNGVSSLSPWLWMGEPLGVDRDLVGRQTSSPGGWAISRVSRPLTPSQASQWGADSRCAGGGRSSDTTARRRRRPPRRRGRRGVGIIDEADREIGNEPLELAWPARPANAGLPCNGALRHLCVHSPVGRLSAPSIPDEAWVDGAASQRAGTSRAAEEGRTRHAGRRVVKWRATCTAAPVVIAQVTAARMSFPVPQARFDA